MPERLEAELHAEERARYLEQLAVAVSTAERDSLRQRTFNIIVIIALVVGAYVIWTNRQSLNILRHATGPEAQAAQRSLIEDLKCDNRQSLGEALASLGYTPPPLREGCDPYSVVIAPRDNQPAQEKTITTSQQAAQPTAERTNYIVVAQPQSPPSTQPQPAPQQPQQPPPSSPPPEEEPPSVCALDLPVIGCAVAASTSSPSVLGTAVTNIL